MAKVAIVTGAGTGVGRAAALALMKAGYSVALAGRRKEPLETVLKEGGGNGIAVPSDVTKVEAVRELFATVNEASAASTCCSTSRHGCGTSAVRRADRRKWKAVVDTNLTALSSARRRRSR